MTLHGKDRTMTELQPRSAVYAWDERDARSIASNTPTYGGALFRVHAEPMPVKAPDRSGPSAGTRLAAMITRIRLRSHPVKIAEG